MEKHSSNCEVCQHLTIASGAESNPKKGGTDKGKALDQKLWTQKVYPSKMGKGKSAQKFVKALFNIQFYRLFVITHFVSIVNFNTHYNHDTEAIGKIFRVFDVAKLS